MAKALKTAGMIVAGVALAATGVGALLMPGFVGATTLFGVSMTTLQTVSAGLAAVGGLLDKPKSQGSASPTDWTSNPDQPTPFAFGRVGVAGKIVHRDEFGPDNMYQGIVAVLSGAGPVRGNFSFTGDEQAVTFGANGVAVTSQWSGEMWMSYRLGNQPDTALTSPPGLKNSATLPGWTSAHKLSGKACYLQTLGENSKISAFGGAEPKPVVEFDGVYGYDPAYDSTYPGGFGDCRYGVRSTYLWIDDPIIAALNWALGMMENGKVVGGVGASIEAIDVASFVEASTVSRANAWKVTAWPDTSEDSAQVLRQLLEAGGAVYARTGGLISCMTRAMPRTSIVTMTARDTAGPFELDTGSSNENRVNQITPSFMSASAGWKIVPANPVTFEAYKTEDGGTKSKGLTYRFVPSATQAAQLAAYDILDPREPFSGTVPIKPHMRRLKKGDCFTVSEPGFLLDGVKCLVLGRPEYDTKTGIGRIAFRSETDGKHPLALGKTTTLPSYPTLTPFDTTYVGPPAPEDWTVVVTPPAPGGTLVPGIDLTGVVTNATADAMLISWRVVAEGEDPAVPPVFLNEDKEIVPGWVDAGIWPPTTQSLTIQGPQSGAVVWIAIRYQRGNNISLPDLRGPLTVGVLTAGDVAPGSTFFDTVRDLIDAAVGDYEPPEIDELRADLEAQITAEGTNRVTALAAEATARTSAITAEAAARAAAIAAEALARGTAITGLETSVSSVATALSAEVSTRTSQYASTSAGLAEVVTLANTVSEALSSETATRTAQYSTLNGNIGAVNTAVTTVATDLSALTSSV
ncbi:MAG: hypothetical protein JWR59_2277, partial [Brevundimonas sp.]|nr:hypothetical protein [Brevundimonas sp.]